MPGPDGRVSPHGTLRWRRAFTACLPVMSDPPLAFLSFIPATIGRDG